MVRELIEDPEIKTADAMNRAARTFVQGLLFDVGLAVVLTVGPLIAGNDFAFSAAYWTTIGLAAAKSVITAGIAYVARYVAANRPATLVAQAAQNLEVR